MATGKIQLTGLDAILEELNGLGANIKEAAKKSIESSLKDIENNMKSNARLALNKGYSQGVMVNSISSKVTINEDGLIFASVGVFNMSNKTGSSGRRMNAAVLAFWHEHGVQPHSTSTGAKKIDESGQGKQQHRGLKPTPFLSSAFDSGAVAIQEDLKKALNKLT